MKNIMWLGDISICMYSVIYIERDIEYQLADFASISIHLSLVNIMNIFLHVHVGFPYRLLTD
jgi:hypothetical protein